MSWTKVLKRATFFTAAIVPLGVQAVEPPGVADLAAGFAFASVFVGTGVARFPALDLSQGVRTD